MEEYEYSEVSISILDRQGDLQRVVRWKQPHNFTSLQQGLETLQHTAEYNAEVTNRESMPCKRFHLQHERKHTATTEQRTQHKVSLYFPIDPMLASCITCQLQSSVPFRKALVVLLLRQCKRHRVTRCLQDARTLETRCERSLTEPVRLKVIFRLTDCIYFRMDPDIQWSNRMLPLWTIRLVLEDAFSWLSTLGGAYSSLGEHFRHCAIEAGKLSLKQLRLAIRLGDPLLQSRCCVYMALSLMQRGFLGHAKHVLRSQYRFAVSLKEQTDTRLINMCQGVWCHLRYYYLLRRQRKEMRCKSRGKYHGFQNGTKATDHDIQN